MEAESVFWHSTENVAAEPDMTRVHWCTLCSKMRKVFQRGECPKFHHFPLETH